MKMKKRLLSIAFIAVTLLLLAVAFTSCKKCDHEWNEWTVTKPATCLEAGEKVRVCVHDSSHVETAVIEKLPHNFENYQIAVEPTCVLNGTKVATCETEGCNATSTIIAPSLDHEFTDYIAIPGDCVTPNSEKAICNNGCNTEDIRIIGDSTTTAGHNYESGWNCSVCGAAHPTEAEYDIADSGTLVAKIYAKSVLNPNTQKYKKVYYLVFEGDGSMIDLSPDALPWEAYTKRIENVEIDERVSSFGSYAFANLQALSSIELPDGINIISDGMFFGSQMSNITIKSSVIAIGISAFEGCTKLETVSFDNGSYLCVIRDRAFYGCSALKNIDLPEYLSDIGEHAFDSCTNLTSLNISENAVNIAGNAFDNTGLRPNDRATAAEIEAAYINYYENGEYLPIGNNPYAIFIGIEAKSKANLRSLVLHKDMLSIAYGALDGANNLEFISVESGNDSFIGIQNCIIDTETKTLVLGIQSSEIPCDGTVIKISKDAFLNCKSLKKIVIPPTITEIEGPAFKGCSSIEEITIPFTGLSNVLGANSFYLIFGEANDIPESLETVKITNVDTIYSGAFYNCSHIKNIYIPSTLKTVQNSAFLGCTRLESVYIDSIDFWFDITFEDPYSTPFGYADYLYVNGEVLEELVVPDRITEIKYLSFAGCDSITTITFNNSLEKISHSSFRDCHSLMEVVIPDSVTNIERYAFANCESLESVALPAGLKSISAYVFMACKSLYEVSIHESIESIDTTAFIACLSLSKIEVSADNANYASLDGILYNKTLDAILYVPHAINGKVTISDKITEIPSGFFASYPELDELIIPDSVTFIGKDAFKGCTSLKSIELPFIGDSISSENSFSYVFGTVPASLEKVIIKSATVIKDGDFAECSGIKEVYLPDGVTSIGIGAFMNCYSLSKIVIPKSVTQIKDNAFEGCMKLSAVFCKSTEAEYGEISIGSNNLFFTTARRYYYNDNVTENGVGDNWYFEADGSIKIW